MCVCVCAILHRSVYLCTLCIFVACVNTYTGHKHAIYACAAYVYMSESVNECVSVTFALYQNLTMLLAPKYSGFSTISFFSLLLKIPVHIVSVSYCLYSSCCNLSTEGFATSIFILQLGKYTDVYVYGLST